MRVVVLFASALILVGCRDNQATGSFNTSCAEKLYSQYNPKNFDQCVTVCNKCERGTTTTCTTSCRLKGAQ
jgi:hypothetical protein